MVSKNYGKGVPKGRIVPMYLSDDGVLYTMAFHNEEELELIEHLITGVMGEKIGIDLNNPISNPDDKIIVYKRK